MCADTCFAVSHCTAVSFLLHFALLFFFSHHIESSMKSLCLRLVECFLWLFSFQVTGMLLCKGICQSLYIVHFIHGRIPVIKCDITINQLIQFRKVAHFSGEQSEEKEATVTKKAKQKHFSARNGKKKTSLFPLFNYDFAHE